MKETMTSRERVIRTLNREPVDRMPIDLGTHPSTGISAFAYWHLRKYLGLDTDSIRIPDVVQFLAKVDQDILERFHCDCYMLEPEWAKTKKWNPRDDYHFFVPSEMDLQKHANGSWIVKRGDEQMRMPEGGYFFDGNWMNKWEKQSEDQLIDLYAREAERIYKETDYACIYNGYSRGPALSSYFGGIEMGCSMYTDPDEVLAENEAACNNSIRIFDKINKAMGPWIQMVLVGNDMGGQKGPLADPVMVEQFSMPYYKRFCDHVHANSDIKVFMHNCGSIKAFIPMIIEAGIDVLNPVQISAEDMDPLELKTRFGSDLIFWGGGCDTQNVLGQGTTELVAQNVRELISAFKPNGGFVFNQVHNILGNVPAENIVAMLDTAYQESFY